MRYVHVTCDSWYLHVTFARDSRYLHVTFDICTWHVTNDIYMWDFHVTCDIFMWLWIFARDIWQAIFICDFWYLHVTYAIFICDIWNAIFTCDLIYSCSKQLSPVSPNLTTAGAFICDVTHSYVSCLILVLRHPHLCTQRLQRERSYVSWPIRNSHESFIRVTWLIHTSHLTWSIQIINTFTLIPHYCRGSIHICDMTHSYVWHDSFICVTWLIRISHESFMY